VTPEQLQALLIQVAPGLDEYLNPNLPRRYGFLLCAFEFGEKGALAYIANAKQDDLEKAMRELIERLASGHTP